MSDQAAEIVEEVTSEPDIQGGDSPSGSHPNEGEEPSSEVKADSKSGQKEVKATEEHKKEELKAERLRKLLEREKATLDAKTEVRRAHQQLEHDRGQFNATLEQLRGEYRTFQEQQQTFQRQQHQFETAINDFRTDPIRWLQKHVGMTPDQVIEAFANDGKPQPHQVISEELGMTRKELQELKHELAREREEARQYQENYRRQQEHYAEQQREAQRLAVIADTERAFVSTITAEDKYPHINIKDSEGNRVYPNEVVLMQARQIVESYGQDAHNMSLEDLADQLESALSEYHEKKLGKVLPKKQSAIDNKQATGPNKAVDPIDDLLPSKAHSKATTTKIRRTPSQTLSNEMAGRSAVKTKPSLEEERARLIQELSRPA